MHSDHLDSGLHACFEDADGNTGFISLETLARNAVGVPKTTSIDPKASKIEQLVQDAYTKGFIKEPIIIEAANNDYRPAPLMPQQAFVVNG